MAKEIDSKVKKVRDEALSILLAKYKKRAEEEADKAAERARRYFEKQDEPNVEQFLDQEPRGRSRKAAKGSQTRECRVCHLPGARNIFSGAKKKDHTRDEHEALKAGKGA